MILILLSIILFQSLIIKVINNGTKIQIQFRKTSRYKKRKEEKVKRKFTKIQKEAGN